MQMPKQYKVLLIIRLIFRLVIRCATMGAEPVAPWKLGQDVLSGTAGIKDTQTLCDTLYRPWAKYVRTVAGFEV